MHVPETLLSLVDEGMIDEVLRPLKSGKEAQIYLVTAGGEQRVAKVYKDAQHRSFKQRAQYIEGRRTRNSRDQRAMHRRTRHGKAQEEAAWKSTEVDIIYRLHAQGVRVPTPYNFVDGVLIMELVRGEDGLPAPRLTDLAPDAELARAYFEGLLREVVKMLCAGIVHGDLSDYNVLVDAAGPVIIDFPQSIEAASNRNARSLLVRDVDNLSAFLARCGLQGRRRPYGQEIWAAYENNLLTPELELSGKFRRSTKAVDMGALLEVIEDADQDERRRREAQGGTGPTPRRREVIVTPAAGKGRGGGRAQPRGASGGTSQPTNGGGRHATGERSQRQRSGSSRRPRSGAPSAAGQDASLGLSAATSTASGGQGQRGEGRQRIASGQAGDSSGSLSPSNGEAATKRRRRRRRGGAAKRNGQGPPAQGGGQRPGEAAVVRPVACGDPAPNQQAATSAPKPRKRRRRRKRSGTEPLASDATSSAQAKRKGADRPD